MALPTLIWTTKKAQRFDFEVKKESKHSCMKSIIDLQTSILTNRRAQRFDVNIKKDFQIQLRCR